MGVVSRPWPLASHKAARTSSWFSVLRELDSHALREPPMASISSMNTMQGAFFLAAAKRARTRRDPTPTNISSNSEPARKKNGTPASLHAGDGGWGGGVSPRSVLSRARPHNTAAPSHGLGEQRLARARRPRQQDALGQLAAQAGETFRLAQVLNHLGV